jgi:HEAT repeat protein
MTHPPEDDLDHIRVFTPEEDEDLDAVEAEQEEKPPLDEVIATLIAGEYPRSVLIGLSDLSTAEAAALDAAWPSIGDEVRLAVASELNDLAEERVDYLFGRAVLTMLDDQDAGVRQRAIAGLWEHADSRLADTLVAMLKSDPSEDVRAEAARGLGRYVEMDELGELKPDRGERVREALLEVLGDESGSLHVRARALESTSVLGDNEAVSAAIERFYDEDDTGFRATAVFAMGRSLNPDFLPTILNETATDDAEVRYEAARAAGRLGDTSALPVLADLADDEDAEVRHAAINAIGEIGGKAAVRYLRRIAESAPEADFELVEAALEEATIVTDPLLLEDEPS